MLSTSESQSLIEEIDARQDDVLARLDALNEQIERLLNEVRPPAPESPAPESPASESQAPHVSAPASPSVELDATFSAELTANPNPVDPADPISRLPAAA